MTTQATSITPQSTMAQVLEVYPGAQRALFRKFHIGGCSSCAFQSGETLAEVCQRNNNLNPEEVLEQLRDSHAQDEKTLISPKALAELRQVHPELRLLDVRSRQEFEAVHIDGSVLMSQEAMQDILSQWPRAEPFVIVDHTGRTGLDAAAYFMGHGFENVRCLRGGIDAWSEEVDPKVRRYRMS